MGREGEMEGRGMGKEGDGKEGGWEGGREGGWEGRGMGREGDGKEGGWEGRGDGKRGGIGIRNDDGECSNWESN